MEKSVCGAGCQEHPPGAEEEEEDYHYQDQSRYVHFGSQFLVIVTLPCNIGYTEKEENYHKDFLMPRKKRNYRKEYDEYHGTAKQRKNRSMRNKARRKLKLKKGDRREVDHKKPLSKGGTNGRRNLRAVSRKVNRKKGSKSTKR